MSSALNMDEIDRDIMQLVQENPSLTHTEIAKRVNRSQPTVGLRIKKLEDMGVLKFHAGLNLKSADLAFARVEIQTRDPQKIIDKVKTCPFMLNAFRLDGELNMMILMACFKFQHLDKIINQQFRKNRDVKQVKLHVITDVVDDFITKFDFKCICCEIDEKADCCQICEKYSF